MRTAEEIERLLTEPIPPEKIKWKIQAVMPTREGRTPQCLMVAFIDAREVMDKLDAVVGPAGWQDTYANVPGTKTVNCRLSLKIGGEWITKEGVGAESDQPDEDDRVKAAYSGALKIAAVKWGIGRSLYHLKRQYVDYDPQRKKPVGTPKVIYEDGYRPAAPRPQQPAQQAQATPPTAHCAQSPAPSFWKRVLDADADWAAKGWIKAGELITYVRDQMGGAQAELRVEREPDTCLALVKAMGAEVKAQHEKAVAEGRA